MGKQKKFEPYVRQILESFPESRDNDNILFALYCASRGYDLTVPMHQALQDPTLPNRETITRVRRKLQEKDENLRGSKRIRKIRADLEEEYREYAKE